MNCRIVGEKPMSFAPNPGRANKTLQNEKWILVQRRIDSREPFRKQGSLRNAVEFRSQPIPGYADAPARLEKGGEFQGLAASSFQVICGVDLVEGTVVAQTVRVAHAQNLFLGIPAIVKSERARVNSLQRKKPDGGKKDQTKSTGHPYPRVKAATLIRRLGGRVKPARPTGRAPMTISKRSSNSVVVEMPAAPVRGSPTGGSSNPVGTPVSEWLAVATEIAVEDAMPSPLLMGRHLLARGHQPGPRIGAIARAAYEAQLDGDFADLAGALAWLEANSDRFS